MFLVCVMICALRSVIMCCFVSRVKDPVLTLTCGAEILVLQFVVMDTAVLGTFALLPPCCYLLLLQEEANVSMILLFCHSM